MTVLELTSEHLARMPVFPLPTVAFLPDTTMPLHIFEPRYRELTAWCLHHDWPMALAAIDPDHVSDDLGTPPFLSIAGAGDIVFSRTLHDGRHIIVLRGIARVRLTEIDSDMPWRLARAALSPDTWPQDHLGLESASATLLSLLRAVGAYHPSLAALAGEVEESGPHPEILTYAVAARIARPPLRQTILEATDIGQRVDLVCDLLASALADLADSDIVH
jgi:Lon protease-like protein